ncbi:MAG: hypothetical protein ABIE23_03220 [archaeon]
MKKLKQRLKRLRSYQSFQKHKKALLQKQFMLPKNIKTCRSFERKYRGLSIKYHDKKNPIFLNKEGYRIMIEFVWGHLSKPNKVLKDLSTIKALKDKQQIPYFLRGIKGKNNFEKKRLIIGEIRKIEENGKKLADIIASYTTYNEHKLMKNPFMKGERFNKQVEIQKQVRHEYVDVIHEIFKKIGLLEYLLEQSVK